MGRIPTWELLLPVFEEATLHLQCGQAYDELLRRLKGKACELVRALWQGDVPKVYYDAFERHLQDIAEPPRGLVEPTGDAWFVLQTACHQALAVLYFKKVFCVKTAEKWLKVERRKQWLPTELLLAHDELTAQLMPHHLEDIKGREGSSWSAPERLEFAKELYRREDSPVEVKRRAVKAAAKAAWILNDNKEFERWARLTRAWDPEFDMFLEKDPLPTAQKETQPQQAGPAQGEGLPVTKPWKKTKEKLGTQDEELEIARLRKKLEVLKKRRRKPGLDGYQQAG